MNNYELAERIDDNARQAGLEVMAEILGIVWNRETVPPERLAALTPDDLAELYEHFIGPAIDQIESELS